MTSLGYTNDSYLNQKQLLEFLGISVPTLWRRVKQGRIKKTIIAGQVFYKFGDLIEVATPQATPELLSKAA